jgi:pilin isopeptide linkage protein
MGKDGFLFDLYCNETGITDTAESGTDGLAKLALHFTAEDIGKTYTYTLTERKGDNPYMTYSEVVYEIQVAVTQDTQTGELVLTVTRDGREATGNAQFENILHPENPKTGEELFIRNWAVLMGISAVGLLAVLVLNKKLVKA